MLTFRLRNTAVQLRFGFFAVMALLLVLDGGQHVPAMLLACAVHESGHLLMARLVGMPVRCVAVSAFGVHMQADTEGLSHLRRAAVSLAGPLMNLLCFCLLLPTGQKALYAVQLILFLFHILPAVPLDGGMALFSALCSVCSVRTAERIVLCVSVLLMLLLGTLGFSVLLRSRYNFTLLLLAVYILLYIALRRCENIS